jgi:hypothetical protein
MGALVLLCAFASPAFASGPTWLSPVKLSVDGSNAQTPVIADDGNGDADAVWTLASGTLQTSFREAGPGDSFTEQDVAGSSGSTAPDVSEDGSGDGEAVWIESGSVNWSYRTNDVDGFGGASTINSDPCAGDESDPVIDVGPTSNPIAAYLCDNGGTEDVEAVYAASGTAGNFNTAPGNPDNGPPSNIFSGANSASNLQIAEDPNGDAILVWQEKNGANVEIWYAYRPAGNTTSWTTAAMVDSLPSDETAPTVAMDGNGNASVAYVIGGNIQEQDASKATIAAEGSFSAPNDLTSDGTASDPQIADDSNGDTAVVWADGGSAVANVRPSGGSFAGTATTLLAIDAGTQPQIAITSAGDAIALWQSDDTIYASVANSSGTFQATPTQVSQGAGVATEPSLAVDNNGNAVAAYIQSDGTNAIATADGYDSGAGPANNNLHIAANGSAGSGLTFYAQPYDVWPAIPQSSISWDFGDGTPAQTGDNVTHTFAHGGNYTVSLTSTNADGNQTTSTQNIDVAASAPARPEGGLTQLPSPNDCVTSGPVGCGTLIKYGLTGAYQPIVSPDGRNVYEVAQGVGVDSGGLVEFSRNTATGALTEIGCITGAASEPGCSTSALAAMDNPSSLAISPDGSSVYVVTQGENAIVTFSRNASTGLLTEVAGDCYDSNGGPVPGCTANPGLSYPWGVVVSQDGRNVYASSNNGQDIAEFTRNATTGALTPVPGNNCISDAANPNGCQVDSGGSMLNLIGIATIGSNVYGVAGGGLGNGDVAEFTRNALTGALSPVAGNSCIGSSTAPPGCLTSATDINGTEDMAITPDGQYAYVNSSNDNAIVELRRNTTSGALSQLGCVGTASSPHGLCSTSNAVGIDDPLGVAVSPDGTNLYASGAGDNAEAAFAINNATGLLTQLPGSFNCITSNSGGCGANDATGVAGARRVVVSPDGKNVYVADQGGDGVVEFARTPIATRATTTMGTEASWDSNDPASSISATITVPAVNCASNASGTVAGQQEGVRLIGSVSGGQHTSFPSEAAEVLTYCNGKTATYATEFVVDDISSDTETYEPAGLPVSPGDPIDLSLSASLGGAGLQMTDVNTGVTKTVSGPGFEAVNGFDIGTAAIPGNGHGAPLLSGSEPDAAQVAVLPGPVQALPTVFANATVGDPPLSSAPGLYEVRWTSGGATVATPGAIGSGGDFTGDIASVPTPATAKSADVAPVSGKVLVKIPGTHKFVPLTSIKKLPNGTLINATNGKVQITVALPNGQTQTGVFFGGEFQLEQVKSGQTTAVLAGGSFKGCPAPGPKKRTKPKKKQKKKAIDASAASFSKKHPVRHLWSNAHGSFTTKGKYGAAAVRGTEWLTQDQCDGTFFRVTRDEITVTSFKLHKKTNVKQGHSYLAPS